MSRESSPGARRAYRWLLRAYPVSHRERYGAVMEDAFITLLRRDQRRWGRLGIVRCWIGAGIDAFRGGLGFRWRARRRPRGAGLGNHGAGGVETMRTILTDTRYAIRTLVKRPVLALAAILTIAIGIGANTSIFTIVNGLVLTPLPYEDPDELIAIWAAYPTLGWSDTDVNHADAWDWRVRASTLEGLTVFNDDEFNLTGAGAPELVSAVRVTPNFLSVFGLRPRYGRDFAPTEIGEGRDGVAILTDGFWQRRFARDPDVLGSTLVLDGEQVVVIGIMSPEFVFYDGRPDMLRPWGFAMADAGRDSHSARAVARLSDGASREAARDELVAIAAELEREHEENEGRTVQVRSLRADVVGDVATQASAVLMAAVTFILLMACVNVANLLLARAGGRSRELALRLALGAGRLRLVRQLLTEATILGCAGALLGFVAAMWGSRAIVQALPSTLSPVFRFELDGSVLAYTVVVTIGATLLFGVLPAVRATGERGATLREGRRAGTGRGGGRFGSALVVLQTAMAVILLVGGGLLMRSVAGMRGQDLGFEPENVLTARIALPAMEYATQEASEAYWRDVTARIRELPGVVEVGTTQSHPLMGSSWGRAVQIQGQDARRGADLSVRLTLASPGLFEALRLRMSRGRVFTDSDGPDGPDVAIVNEAFVARYLGPDDDPLAQTLTSGEQWAASVVGVVHDVVEDDVDEPPQPTMYVPTAQSDFRTRSLVVRTMDDPAEIVPRMQDAVWSVDADIPVYGVRTLEDQVEESIGGFLVIGVLMAIFAVLSVVLGAVGIYGVTAYAAGRRTAEIGVRLAIGAEHSDVVRMVVMQGATRAALGLGIGLAVTAAMGGAMSHILVGVDPRDPLTFGAVAAVLSSVSLLALYLPARRASRLDPVRALAAE